jgi:fatty acid desaturase
MSDAQPTDPELRTRPKRADQSLGELASDLTTELGQLFRAEVELAKVEATAEAKAAAVAAGALAAAGLAALLAVAWASIALVHLLDESMPRGLAWVVVAAMWAVVAIILLIIGKRRLSRIRPFPETTETLKEDLQWTKTLTD